MLYFFVTKCFLLPFKDYSVQCICIYAHQLNVGSFNCGLPALVPALPVAFYLALLSAGSATSVMALITSLVALMAN